MLRLFSQIDIGPPRNGLPRAISGHTIFEASTQNQTPTSLHAICQDEEEELCDHVQGVPPM